jgi:HNH endonuclease
MTTEALEAAIAHHFSGDARAAYEWQRRFDAYVSSEAWQHKRFQKLLSMVGIAAHSYETLDWLAQQASRYPYHCEKCGSRGAHTEVQVHHRHYRNLGNEPLDDLVVLCGFCHQALHNVARATGLPLEVVTAHLMGSLREPWGQGIRDGTAGVASIFANRPVAAPLTFADVQARLRASLRSEA